MPILYELELRSDSRALAGKDFRSIDDAHAIIYGPRAAKRLVGQYLAAKDSVGAEATCWTVRRAYGYCCPVLARGRLEETA